MIKHDSVGREFIVVDGELKKLTNVKPARMTIQLILSDTERKSQVKTITGQTVEEVQRRIRLLIKFNQYVANIQVVVYDDADNVIYYFIDVFCYDWEVSSGYKRMFSENIIIMLLHLNAP